MGCHTWFRNKIADMPLAHLERLRQWHIRCIKNSYIYNCSCEQWLKDCEEDIKELEEDIASSDSSTKEMYEMELKWAKKRNSKEYYEKARGKYVKDLEILENPKSKRNQLLRVFSRHDLSFDKDLKNGSYEMTHVGWNDNYRVSGYPCVTHHNAEEAIQWLEEYDNGRNIRYDLNRGMCQEIRDIVINFFNEFPNGTIHYG